MNQRRCLAHRKRHAKSAALARLTRRGQFTAESGSQTLSDRQAEAEAGDAIAASVGGAKKRRKDER